VIDSFSDWRTTIFITIVVISIIGQYLVLEFIRRKSKEARLREQLHLDKIHIFVSISQYTIAAILVFIFVQMITLSSYNNSMIIAGITVSYVLATILMSILAKRFFSWFTLNRNTVVILYAVSSAVIAVNAGISVIFVDLLLMQQPTDVGPHPSTLSPALFLFSASWTSVLNYAFIISSLVSFVLFWVATVFLLRHYSERIGPVKYWLMLSIPLFYFTSQFLPYFVDLFSSFRQSEPILFAITYTVIFTLSKPVGGILFGIAFWIIARTIPHNLAVRDYLIISALGIVLLFTSNQAIILVSFSYPPFGIATISFMGLSSYLIFIGIYSSAISLAHDTNLRKLIKTSTLQQSSKLLDSIGTAQMIKQIEDKVIKATEEDAYKLAEQTGVEPSLTHGEMKLYLEKVLDEIKPKREPS
jgi:hypothetical protein